MGIAQIALDPPPPLCQMGKHEKLLQTKIQEYLGKALFEICCFQRPKAIWAMPI